MVVVVWCGVGGMVFFTNNNTTPTKVVLSCFGLLVVLWQFQFVLKLKLLTISNTIYYIICNPRKSNPTYLLFTFSNHYGCEISAFPVNSFSSVTCRVRQASDCTQFCAMQNLLANPIAFPGITQAQICKTKKLFKSQECILGGLCH